MSPEQATKIRAQLVEEKVKKLEDENNHLRESVKFWQADASVAWDKCEERRKALERILKIVSEAML